MKKFLLSLIALLGVVSANAQTTADVSGSDNAIFAEGGTYPVGNEILVPIKIKNGIDAQACTFYVTLQDGLSFAEDTEDATSIMCTVPNSNHTVMSNINNGMIALYSAKNSELPESFLLLHLVTDESVAPGEYTIKIHDMRISNGDNGKEIAVEDEFVSTILLTSDLVLDEASESFPVVDYTGKVLVKRTIKANQWSTIVLPFSLTQAKAKLAFGDNVKLATFSGFETEYENEESVVPISITVNFAEYAMTVRKGMIACTPYLIKVEDDIETFTADGITIANPSVLNQSGKDADEVTGIFTGSFAKAVVPEDGLFISGEKFYYSVGKTNIKGFRGWFELGAVLDKETQFGVKLNVLVDGEETAIDDIRVVDTKGAVYTIDGKFIGRDVDLKKLQKGIYVVDGKKVAIK